MEQGLRLKFEGIGLRGKGLRLGSKVREIRVSGFSL